MKPGILAATPRARPVPPPLGPALDKAFTVRYRDYADAMREVARPVKGVLVVPGASTDRDRVVEILQHAEAHQRPTALLVNRLADLRHVGPLVGTGSHQFQIPMPRTAEEAIDVLNALQLVYAGRDERLASIRPLPAERAFLVIFRDGRSFELPYARIRAHQPRSPVRRVRIQPEAPDGFLVKQSSGNRYDVSADFVLYCCDPGYRLRVEAETPKRAGRRASVGGRVRSLREARGWSQADLARRAGVQRQELARLESGRHRLPLPTLEAVGNVFKVPLADLVARQDRAVALPW